MQPTVVTGACGFVAIDLVPLALGPLLGRLLNLLFLVLSLLVLCAALWFGWKHVNGGWLFGSSSLKIPLDWFGGKPTAIKLAWMYLSIWVGMVLMTLVNVELILRHVVGLVDPEREPPPDPAAMATQAD